MSRVRLDAALAARGLARSRSHASQLIAEGRVTLNGRQVDKPALAIIDTDQLTVSGNAERVSRAAGKLEFALDQFDLDVAGRLCLDAGASTGGFTQVLVERGARQVVAVDVGHGQLAERLRVDNRIVVVEGYNVRDLSQAQVLAWTDGELPTVVVADLSFISLRLVLGPLTRSADPSAEFVVLVKPQFELQPRALRGGIVMKPNDRVRALLGVLDHAAELGLLVSGLVPSPLRGEHGNREFLLWLSRSTGSHPSEWVQHVEEVAG